MYPSLFLYNPILGDMIMSRLLVSQHGNPVQTQRVETDSFGTDRFFSYNTLIAERTKEGKIFLSEDWNYSATTNKYRCQFLGEKGDVTKKKIKSGEYVVIADGTDWEIK